jgi:hypothetical protein
VVLGRPFSLDSISSAEVENSNDPLYYLLIYFRAALRVAPLLRIRLQLKQFASCCATVNRCGYGARVFIATASLYNSGAAYIEQALLGEIEKSPSKTMLQGRLRIHYARNSGPTCTGLDS